MFLKYNKKKITGILTVIPKREVTFEEEIANYNFPASQSLKLKMAMGYVKHAIVDDNTCVSDLCLHGINYLLENNLLQKEEINAIILVTQTPDYLMPPTSNIIHGELGLENDVICMDINQGCSGYIIGLMQAFMLLEQDAINKVVLLNADILSPKVSKRDRNSNPIIGDAATVTIVEKNPEICSIYGYLKTDGINADALKIPAGGLRIPCSSETSIQEEDAAGNFRSQENLVMNGSDVFNFVQREVPPMITDILTYANVDKDEIDWYMFHQPNKFMLNKLADSIGISRDKLPANIVENFGNASGATIPTNISFNLGENLKVNNYKMCLAGFGVGLTWASLIMDIGNVNFNQIIRY